MFLGDNSGRRLEIRRADDLLSKRHERSPRHLETANPERDPDDRQTQKDPEKQMAEREPPSREDEPQNVRNHTQALGPSRSRYELASKRPERVGRELERLHPKRDADDRQAHHHTR